MKRKPQEKPEAAIAPEIIESARRSAAGERPRPVLKCVVCTAETTGSGAEPLCWVCRRLKISAWRDIEQQAPAQE